MVPGMMNIFTGSRKVAVDACPARDSPLTETPKNLPHRGPPEDEPPPILGSWRRVYTAILLHLLFWIGVFYAFTVEFDLPR
jgi:hypothetical protein